MSTGTLDEELTVLVGVSGRGSFAVLLEGLYKLHKAGFVVVQRAGRLAVALGDTAAVGVVGGE